MSPHPDSPSLYRQRMDKEYSFYRWLMQNNIGGVIYSLTEVHQAATDFIDFLPYYVFMVELAGGERKTLMATDEALRDDQPQIGDRVEFVFRRTRPISDDDAGLIQYSVKARRI